MFGFIKKHDFLTLIKVKKLIFHLRHKSKIYLMRWKKKIFPKVLINCAGYFNNFPILI